jgi:hypothetical protein
MLTSTQQLTDAGNILDTKQNRSKTDDTNDHRTVILQDLCRTLALSPGTVASCLQAALAPACDGVRCNPCGWQNAWLGIEGGEDVPACVGVRCHQCGWQINI